MNIKIVHLSDLHLADCHFKRRENTKDDTIPKAVATSHAPIGDNIEHGSVIGGIIDQITKISPDVLVVSGDIASGRTSDAKKYSFSLFNKFIRLVRQSAGENLVVLPVPGNHDVDRPAGVGNLDSFYKLIHTEHINRYPTFKEIGKAFPGNVFCCRNHVIIQDKKIIFTLFNSAVVGGAEVSDITDAISALEKFGGHDDLIERLKSRAHEDPAIVDHSQLAEAAAGLKSLQLALDDYNNFRLVAILHHHLSVNREITEYKRYDVVVNAGDVKEFLATYKYHLVLHGHKHQQKVVFERVIDTANVWGVHIIGSGSTTSDQRILQIEGNDDHYIVSAVDDSPSRVIATLAPGVDTADECPIMAWPGYRDVPDVNLRAKECRVRFLEHSGLGVLGKTLSLDGNDFAVIIDDYDELELLGLDEFAKRGGRVLRSSAELIATGITNLLPNLKYLPLRCGINAIAVSGNTFGYNPITRKLRFRRTDSDHIDIQAILKGKCENGPLSIGFWDNANVSVPLLFSYMGFGNITQSGTRLANSRIRLSFIEAASKIKITKVYRDVTDLSDALHKDKVNIVIGGGAWIKRRNQSGNSIHTLLPEQGGFLWFEAAAFVDDTNKVARDFVKFLLEGKVQRSLLKTDEFFTAPVIASEPIEDDDSCIIYHDGGRQINPALFPRIGNPDEAEIFRAVWREIKARWLGSGSPVNVPPRVKLEARPPHNAG